MNYNTPDPAKSGFSAIQQVLTRLATESPSGALWVGTATELRRALTELETATQDGRPVLASIGEPIPVSLLESLRRSSELLFAIGADSTREQFRDKGGAADWSKVAAKMIAETRDQLVTEERDALLNAFAQAGDVPELTLIPFQDPKAVHLVTDRWAVWLDATSWESIKGLHSIPDALRLRLAFRVIVIPVVGEIALPLGAQQPGTELMFPVSDEEVHAYCTAAGKTPLISPHQSAFREYCDQIIEASRLASLHWQRDVTWRSEDTLHTAQRCLDRAREIAGKLPGDEIQDFAVRNANVVEAEIQRGGHPLAAAFHNVPAEAQDDAVLKEFNAMSWLVSLNDAAVAQS